MLYVCYSVNDSYVPEAGISLTGFFENNPDYEPEEVFFLDYGIFPDNKRRLDSVAAHYGKRITYLPAKTYTDEVKRRFPRLKGWKGSMAPNAKPFVDKILPLFPPQKMKEPKGFRERCGSWLMHQMCERRPFWMMRLIFWMIYRF